MKISVMPRLTALAIGASSLLYSGCASPMPTSAKIATTPIVAARDILSIPLSATATGLDYFSNVNRQRKDCDLQQNMFKYRSLIGQQEFKLCEFSAELSTDIIGGLDYCLFRWPSEQRSWKDKGATLTEHYFPGLNDIWGRQYWEDPFTGKKERID